MSFDFINIVGVVSAIISLVIGFRTKKEIISDKKKRKEVLKNAEETIEDIDYKRIKASTYWLEHERQRNKGNHFEDEGVYLNRAQVIRERTSFFSFIND